MSLLNEVLQDLDTRRSPDSSPNASPEQDMLRQYAAGATHPGGVSRLATGPIVTGVAITLCLVAALAWWMFRDDEAVAVSSPVAAPSPSLVPPVKAPDAAEPVTAGRTGVAEAEDASALEPAGPAGTASTPNKLTDSASLGDSAKQALGQMLDSASSTLRSVVPGLAGEPSRSKATGADSTLQLAADSGSVSVKPAPPAVVVKKVSRTPVKPERKVVSRKQAPVVAASTSRYTRGRGVQTPRTAARSFTKTTDLKRLNEQDLNMRAEAEQLIRSGDQIEAETMLREFVREHPGAQHSRSTLASLMIQQGRADDGEKLLLGGIGMDANGRDRVKLMARARMARGDNDAALRLLDANQVQIAEDAEYHSLRAALYQRAGRHKAAVEIYRKLLNEFPSQPAWLVGMAISLESSDRRRDAIVAYRQARDAYSTPPVLKKYSEERIAALSR